MTDSRDKQAWMVESGGCSPVSDSSHCSLASQPIKWHGGKSYLAKWIISNFPDRETYTHFNEAFAGGLSVLFSHDPNGKSEAVNDLNSGLSDFWSVLAQTPERMLRELWGTPLSQRVWDAAEEDLANSDRVKRATAFFIRYRQSRQGLGKDYTTPTRRTRRGMNEQVSAWLSAVEGLPAAHERLKRVEIRNMDALAFIKKYDHEKALFYLDPPYLHETRVTTSDYQHEMTLEDHMTLLGLLESDFKGRFILSGYHSEYYDNWADDNGFRCVEREIDNKASSKAVKEKKTECLWMNYVQ